MFVKQPHRTSKCDFAPRFLAYRLNLVCCQKDEYKTRVKCVSVFLTSIFSTLLNQSLSTLTIWSVVEIDRIDSSWQIDSMKNAAAIHWFKWIFFITLCRVNPKFATKCCNHLWQSNFTICGTIFPSSIRPSVCLRGYEFIDEFIKQLRKITERETIELVYVLCIHSNGNCIIQSRQRVRFSKFVNWANEMCPIHNTKQQPNLHTRYKR